ncbi:MAG: excisionase [Acidimicrobiales bacterium]
MAEQRWVTLPEAAAAAGVSRSTLRSWYRAGRLASRLVPGPNGPMREVPLEPVLARARLGDRLAAAARPAPPGAPDGGEPAVAALEAALLRAEQRAERAEAALRTALQRAARAEAALARSGVG